MTLVIKDFRCELANRPEASWKKPNNNNNNPCGPVPGPLSLLLPFIINLWQYMCIYIYCVYILQVLSREIYSNICVWIYIYIVSEFRNKCMNIYVYIFIHFFLNSETTFPHRIHQRYFSLVFYDVRVADSWRHIRSVLWRKPDFICASDCDFYFRWN